jgi:uncharacterized protein (DUF488 family)
MLNRQKLLIYLLKLADRPVSRLELTKWCFLLRYEGDARGGSSFYDFVPYQYGPFSFALYQEADKLVTESYLTDDGDNHWSLNDELVAQVDGPGPQLERDAKRLIARFRRATPSALADYVYERYPAFTVNSKTRRLASKQIAKPAIYTAGYEGLSIDGFLSLLVETGVRRLIDVRNNPIARRYGFHKSTLKRLVERLEIDYEHIPELGIPSELRQDLTDRAAYDALFRAYEETTLRTQQTAIARVETLVRESPCVLVCMESEPCCCHRSRLARRVADHTDLPIVHLSGKPNGRIETN